MVIFVWSHSVTTESFNKGLFPLQGTHSAPVSSTPFWHFFLLFNTPITVLEELRPWWKATKCNAWMCYIEVLSWELLKHLRFTFSLIRWVSIFKTEHQSVLQLCSMFVPFHVSTRKGCSPCRHSSTESPQSGANPHLHTSFSHANPSLHEIRYVIKQQAPKTRTQTCRIKRNCSERYTECIVDKQRGWWSDRMSLI